MTDLVDVLDTPVAGGMVIRGGALRVAGFAAGTVLSLGGVVLLTRHLGVRDYGRYQTVISVVSIVQVVTDAGMGALGVREYSQRQGAERERLMRVLLGLRVLVTSIGVLIAAALVAALGYGSGLVLGTILMGAGLVIVLLQTTLQIPLAAELRLGTISAIDVLRQALSAGLIAALVLAGAGLVPFFAVTIPAHLAILLWTFLLVRGRIPWVPSFAWSEWLALLRPAAAFALAVTVGVIYLYMSQVLVSLFGTDKETGLYSAAFRVFVIIAAVPGILVTSAFPVLARAARDDRVRLAGAMHSLFRGTLILGGAAAVGCIVGATAVIEVVGGPGYADAAPVLRIQGVVLLETFVLSTLGFTLLSMHHHRALAYANGAGLLVVMVLVPLLVQSFGEQGAAVATLVGETTLLAAYVRALARIDRSFTPPLDAALRLLPALAVGLAPALIPGLPAVPATVLGLVLYGVAVIVSGAVPADVAGHLPAPLARLLQRRGAADLED